MAKLFTNASGATWCLCLLNLLAIRCLQLWCQPMGPLCLWQCLNIEHGKGARVSTVLKHLARSVQCTFTVHKYIYILWVVLRRNIFTNTWNLRWRVWGWWLVWYYRHNIGGGDTILKILLARYRSDQILPWYLNIHPTHTNPFWPCGIQGQKHFGPFFQSIIGCTIYLKDTEGVLGVHRLNQR